jgi:hypothetical protein
MYSGGFYPFESFEEHWAYWSRYIGEVRWLSKKMQNKNYIFRKIDSMQYKRLYKNLFSVLKY